jgi:hypothetical protein
LVLVPDFHNNNELASIKGKKGNEEQRRMRLPQSKIQKEQHHGPVAPSHTIEAQKESMKTNIEKPIYSKGISSV